MKMPSCLAQVVPGLLVVTTSLLMTSALTYHQDEQRINAELNQIVHSLNTVQVAQEKRVHDQQCVTASTVSERYPWAIQNNTLPNYFLSDHDKGKEDVYSQGAVVFLHHHRSAGTALRKCMEQIAEAKSFASSPVMGSNDRLDWDQKLKQTSDFRDKLKFHRGQYSFGMCNDLERECSYFTILRDPMERAWSSYEYCKHAYGDEMCKVVNANDMTLREWVLHHGSLTFQQLLFQSEWCHLVDKTSESHNNVLSEKPCWFKHKLRLQKIESADYAHLVKHVLDNLEKYFAVIGIYEELENSLKMLEHVYKLPFTQCENLKSLDSESNINDNRSNRKKRRVGFYDDNDPEYLKYDYEVQQALDADIKIYKKARKLFLLQKQRLLNRMGGLR